MKYLHLSLQYEREVQHPMQQLLTDSETLERSWLITWNLLGEGNIIHTLFYLIGDRERYKQHIAGAEGTVDYNITPVDDSSFYAYVQEREKEIFKRFRTAFQKPSVVVVPPLAYRPNGRVDFNVVGKPEDLAGILDRLPDEITAEVSEIGEYDVRPSVPAADLTARQREALRAAVEVGFYEYPRTGSVADVAEILDCATSTASNHLQKAEARLVRRFIGNRRPR
ncbi:helix-turn-helix domain-containing protein [Natronorubrum halophilum]|uniref:helix-turn-helix domain-containing protein n=1 Tax=Natronorubrum halophilum TaxID=1702106 RepID=UPI001EE7E424|nr:helix-turn-helix domain-containing protein [Natronorubrum halophilum]